MMNELMIIGLIGDEKFTEILIGLPDEFFKLDKPLQEELWRLILTQINRGVIEIEKLISFAKLWLMLYQYETLKGFDI